MARYLLERGYEIVPVYPREEQILGQKVYRRVQDVAGAVDLVDVFRRSEELPEVIDDALAAGRGALWLQLGCIDESGARRARDAGLTVVMDRCLMVEHARLVGRRWVRDVGPERRGRPAAVAEEQPRADRLRRTVDVACAVLRQGRLSRAEAEALVADTRRAGARALPGQGGRVRPRARPALPPDPRRVLPAARARVLPFRRG